MQQLSHKEQGAVGYSSFEHEAAEMGSGPRVLMQMARRSII
jgi:hypothetical protein